MRSLSFFRSDPSKDFTIKNITGVMNTADADLDIKDHELSGGQNVKPISSTSFGKRDGISLYGNFLGVTTGILGGFSFSNVAGTQEELIVYDTGVYRLVNSVWTALTSVTMTTNKPADGVFFFPTNKFYIVNQTDNCVKYTAGATAGDQTDAGIPKGKYIAEYQGRLLVGCVAGTENGIKFSNDQSDTFIAGNGFVVDATITGLESYFDKLMIFTKKRVIRLANYDWVQGTGSNNYIANLLPLPTEFGAIYDRTIKVVNGLIYFVGQSNEGVADIYACDGYKTYPISDKRIRKTLNGLSPAQLGNACAVADAKTYRVYIAELGQTTNNIGIIYDTVINDFYTPEKRFVAGRSDFSCLWTAEISGEQVVFGGTQGTGQVYRLHANDGLYDELPEERYLTLGTTNLAIDANPAKRASMSFKASNYNITQTVYLNKLVLRMKKNAGTTTELTVRIETDNAGDPSGTLAAATATTTITAFSDSSYVYKTITFSTPVALLGNTTYHAVVKHTTEGAGNSQYYWSADSCTPTYTNGNAGRYSGSWAKDQGTDANFIAYFQSAIDGYGDTKAFLPNKGREFQLQRFQTIFSTSGNYFVEVGFDSGSYNTFQNYLIDLTSGSSSVYDTAVYDTSVYDGEIARNFQWKEVDAFVGRTLKMRVRNRNANEQFEYNQANFKLTPKLRDS